MFFSLTILAYAFISGKDSSVDHVESCHQQNEGIRYLSLQLTIDGKEGVVDGDDGGVGMVEGGAHDEAADAAESVDTDLDGHGFFGVDDKCCDVVVGECRKNEIEKIFVRLRACQ